MKNKPLTIDIKDDELQITIGIDTLAWALEHAIDQRLLKITDEGDILTYKVVDAKQLAEDVVFALCAEEEDGTTPVHILLDNALYSAVEDGTEAIEEEMSMAEW